MIHLIIIWNIFYAFHQYQYLQSVIIIWTYIDGTIFSIEYIQGVEFNSELISLKKRMNEMEA